MIFKASYWNDSVRLLYSTVRLKCHAGHAYSGTGLITDSWKQSGLTCQLASAT